MGYPSFAPAHELFVRTQAKEFPLGEAKSPGLCRLIWRKDGQRLLTTRAVLLPEGGSITYVPGANSHEGSIRLASWPDVPIRCANDEIELRSLHDGANLLLMLKSTSTRPATSVQLCLQWPDGEQRITLAFPGYGVTLLRNDVPLKPNQALTIEELIGCRALLMSAQGAENWVVRLRTNGLGARPPLTHEISYTGVREIRLFELIPGIQQMLSCHPGLDHVVQLELVHAHQTLARLQVARYSTYIRLHDQREMTSLSNGGRDLMLDQPQAEGLILALPLAEPDYEPVILPLQFSEKVFTGNWLVSLPGKAIGPWLLYSPAESSLHSRPTIVPATTINSKPLTPLRQALCEADGSIRMSMLRAALCSMTADPNDADWRTLEQLLERLHHLPLASLDICQALIREPQALAMATLLLDGFASRMAERLPSELPFEWLLISPDHWFNTFAILSQQFSDSNDLLLSTIRNDIHSKSQYLSRWQPALSFIFEQGLYRYFNLPSPDAQFFQKNPTVLTGIWLDRLFEGGEKSAMQRMFQLNPAETHKYPDAGNSDIGAFLKTPHGQLLLRHCKLPANDFKLAILMLPFMAAFDAHAGNGRRWQADAVRLFSLRNARQFDTVWFDLAYQLGLAMAQADSMQK